MDLLHFAVVFGGGCDVGVAGFYDPPTVQPVVFTFTHAVKHHVRHFLVILISRETDLTTEREPFLSKER